MKTWARAQNPLANKLGYARRASRFARPIQPGTRAPLPSAKMVATIMNPVDIEEQASAQILNPREDFGTSLRVWWRFDFSAVTLSGSVITSVADQSGNGFALTQEPAQNGPVYDATGGPNGTPVAIFTAAQLDVLGCDLTNAFNIGDSYSVLLVFAAPNITPNSGLPVLHWGDHLEVTITDDPVRTELVYTGQNFATGGDQNIGLGFSDSLPHTIVSVPNGSGLSVYVDRVLQTPGVLAGTIFPITAPLGQGRLGGATGGSYHDCRWSEVVFVRGAITHDQRLAWNNYVVDRYNI